MSTMTWISVKDRLHERCNREVYEFKIESGYKVFCCSFHSNKYVEYNKKNKKLSKSDD